MYRNLNISKKQNEMILKNKFPVAFEMKERMSIYVVDTEMVNKVG